MKRHQYIEKVNTGQESPLGNELHDDTVRLKTSMGKG